MPTAFQQYALSLAPTWLQGPFGQGYMNAIGALLDALVDREKLANKADMPLVAPPDGLARIGSERGLPRGNSETDASFATRLQNAWNTWLFAGTASGVLRALYDAGYPNTAIVQNNGNVYTLDANQSPVVTPSPTWTFDNQSAPGPLPNLVPNPSFEANAGGLGSGWSVFNNSSGTEPTTASIVAGLYGASAQRVSWAVNNTTTKGINLSGNVAESMIRGGWTPNTTYTVNWSARASGTNVGQTLGLAWNRAPTTTTLLNPALSGSFQQYSFRITWGNAVDNGFPLGSNPAMVGNLWLTLNAATNGTLDFDGVSVVQGSTTPDYMNSTFGRRLWAANSVFEENQAVTPNPANGFWYQAVIGGGKTAGSQPTFPTTVGQTVADNAVTWVCRGRDFWSRFAVMFFTPFPASWSGVPPAYGSAEVTRIRALINQWKPALSTCVEAIAVITAGVWGFQDGTWGDGSLWGGTSTIWSPI